MRLHLLLSVIFFTALSLSYTHHVYGIDITSNSIQYLQSATRKQWVQVDDIVESSAHGVAGTGCEKHTTVLFALSLPEQVKNQIFDTAYAVSDPCSQSYGKHHQIIHESHSQDLEPAAVTVKKWLLTDIGIESTDITDFKGKDFIRVRMTQTHIKRAFGCDLIPFKHHHSRHESQSDPSSSSVLHRCIPTDHPLYESLSSSDSNSQSVPWIAPGEFAHILLPSHIKDIVDVVTGVFELPLLEHVKQQGPTPTPDPVPAAAAPAAAQRDSMQSDAAPQWVNTASSDTQIYFQFSPVCLDGSPASSDLCKSNPPQISSFTIATLNGTNSQPTFTHIGCDGSKGPDGQPLKHTLTPDGGIVCANSAPVTAFDMVNISIQTIFEDGTATAFNNFPNQILASPFVDVALAHIFYGFSHTVPQQLRNGSQAVVEFSHNFFAPSLLKEFFSSNGVEPIDITVVGPNDPTDPEGEADQDVQWIAGIAQQVPTTFWSVKNASGFILDWQAEVANTPNDSLPLVWSISYGQSEQITMMQFGANYIQRCELEFAKMAARGLTVVIADGDSGVSSGLGCPTDPKAAQPAFQPDWPASSAWVVSAGASTIASYTGAAVATSPANGLAFATGGGFSSVIARPQYQTEVVETYLKTAAASGQLPPAKYANLTFGRAFPDVSTLGTGLLTFYANQGWLNPFPGGGTSFSAPLFAGMLSLVNNKRISNGEPPLGFANPWIYKLSSTYPDTFLDVTVGGNSCIAFGTPCCKYGYTCMPGWDAVSGIGSPLMNEIMQHALTTAAKKMC
jgi:Pro-kumamolisin, activation domain/Subtilase family